MFYVFSFPKKSCESKDLCILPWSHLIFEPKYAAYVDMYEGGYNHARGIYRSENMSVMGNLPIPYFNTISRESIVRRIKKYAGQTFSLEEFMANDKIEIPEEWMNNS